MLSQEETQWVFNELEEPTGAAEKRVMPRGAGCDGEGTGCPLDGLGLQVPATLQTPRKTDGRYGLAARLCHTGQMLHLNIFDILLR